MNERDNQRGWLSAITEMMDDTRDAREGAPTLPPDGGLVGDVGDCEVDTGTIRPMKHSPKVAERQKAEEEARMARKTYLVREEEEVWRAGYLWCCCVYERPRDDVDPPPDGVLPMQPIWSLGVGETVIWSTTNFMHAAHRFHALADGCHLGDAQSLTLLTGVTYAQT